MKNFIVIIWQFVTYFIIGIPLRFIFNVKTNVSYSLQKNKCYIIAANHPKIIDPFLISYSIPLRDFIKLIPLRFITAEKYMENIFLGPLLLLCGCISTKQKNGKSVLEKSKALLKKGETIFIFPSGKLEQENKRYMAKVGANYLEREIKDSLILPVKIYYNTSAVDIEFKETFRHSSFPENLQALANETYDIILNKDSINKKNLYELRWSIENNPNGWIEPTTYCQLKCKGCYRGLAEDNPLRKHEDLNRLKKEVDWFIMNRNVQTISIAGGEPLMYPHLYDLIKYISQKGLKSKIYTNAILLNEEKLIKLKDAGVTEIVIHIDKFQRNATSEELMNNLRDKYCSLFRKIGGVNLGFIMPISKKNKEDVDILANFFQKNSDIINLVVFTVYKEMLPHKYVSKELEISMDDVSTQVKTSFGLDYCAYLGKKISNDISWLFSLSAYSGGKYLGSFDGDFYKKLQERYYFKKKKYFITVKNKPFNLIKLLPFIFNNSVRKILMKGLFKPNKEVNTQVVLIIDAPTKNDEVWDLCQGCPDAMLHNDVLVPSCLLERIKSGEKILTE